MCNKVPPPKASFLLQPICRQPSTSIAATLTCQLPCQEKNEFLTKTSPTCWIQGCPLHRNCRFMLLHPFLQHQELRSEAASKQHLRLFLKKLDADDFNGLDWHCKKDAPTLITKECSFSEGSTHLYSWILQICRCIYIYIFPIIIIYTSMSIYIYIMSSLSIYPSIHPSIDLSLSLSLSVCLSVYLSVCLSICLSTYVSLIL